MQYKVGQEFVNENAPSGKLHFKVIGMDVIRERLKSGKTKVRDRIIKFENLRIEKTSYRNEETYRKLRFFSMKEEILNGLLERKVIKPKE